MALRSRTLVGLTASASTRSTLTRVTTKALTSRTNGRKRVARGVLAIFMMGMGLAHLVAPAPFMRAMPPYLPWHLGLVYLSGVFELAGGIGLLVPRVRVAAAWGLIALYVAVFPANVHMALHPDDASLAWVLWARLPFQAAFIAWAWWFTRPDAAARARSGGERVT